VVRIRTPPLALACLAFAVGVWGVNWPLIKGALAVVGAVEFTACRLIGAAVLIALARSALGCAVRVPAAELGPLAAVGLLQMGGGLGLSLAALQHLPVGHGSVLFYSMPAWLVLIEVATRATRVSALGAVALALTTGGVVLLEHERAGLSQAAFGLGSGLMLAAAVSWALGIALYRRLSFRADVWSQTVVQLLASGLALGAALTILPGARAPTPTPALALVLLFNWIAATGLAYVAWHHALTHVTGAAATQTLMLVPVVATAAAALQGETPTLPGAAAALLVIGGVSLTLWREAPERAPAA
jgi:drug/metabolite transporter (DMT)-like permease